MTFDFNKLLRPDPDVKGEVEKETKKLTREDVGFERVKPSDERVEAHIDAVMAAIKDKNLEDQGIILTGAITKLMFMRGMADKDEGIKLLMSVCTTLICNTTKHAGARKGLLVILEKLIEVLD